MCTLLAEKNWRNFGFPACRAGPPVFCRIIFSGFALWQKNGQPSRPGHAKILIQKTFEREGTRGRGRGEGRGEGKGGGKVGVGVGGRRGRERGGRMEGRGKM